MGDVNIYNSSENGSAYIRAKTYTSFLNTVEQLRKIVNSETQVDQEQLEQKIQTLKDLFLEVTKNQPHNFTRLCKYFIVTFYSDSYVFINRLPSSLNIFKDDEFVAELNAELKAIRPDVARELKRIISIIN